MATDNFASIVGVDWMHLGEDPVVEAPVVEQEEEQVQEYDSEPDPVDGSPLRTPSPPPPPSLPDPNRTPSPPPSPEPTVENARPFWGGAPQPPEREPVWDMYRGRTGPSGWIVNDIGLANQMMGAAYTAAMCGFRLRGQPVRRLNCHWNRPLDHDVKPHGYNKRGDIAPQIVHIKLDIFLDDDHFSFRERMLVHGVMDKIWLLHSRSEHVDDALDREMWFLSPAHRRDLGVLLNEHMLDDLRLVMCTLDPRKNVIYGRTRDTNPAPRLVTKYYDIDDMTTRNNHGSDDDDTDNEHNGIPSIPYTLSPWEQHTQYVHECMKRVRRLEKQAIQYEDYANQAQIRVDEIMKRLERADSLRETLRRGMSAERGPLELLESQRQFAFAGYERRRREEYQREYERQVTAENRPPTPPMDP